jgi:hypothetical protein
MLVEHDAPSFLGLPSQTKEQAVPENDDRSKAGPVGEEDTVGYLYRINMYDGSAGRSSGAS